MEDHLRILFFLFMHTLFKLHLIGIFYKLSTALSAMSTAGLRANHIVSGGYRQVEIGHQVILTLGQDNSRCSGTDRKHV